MLVNTFSQETSSSLVTRFYKSSIEKPSPSSFNNLFSSSSITSDYIFRRIPLKFLWWFLPRAINVFNCIFNGLVYPKSFKLSSFLSLVLKEVNKMFPINSNWVSQSITDEGISLIPLPICGEFKSNQYRSYLLGYSLKPLIVKMYCLLVYWNVLCKNPMCYF